MDTPSLRHQGIKVNQVISSAISPDGVVVIDTNYPRKLYMGEKTLKVFNKEEEISMLKEGWYNVERRLNELKGIKEPQKIEEKLTESIDIEVDVPVIPDIPQPKRGRKPKV